MAGKIKKYSLISALLAIALIAGVGFGLIPVNLFFAKAAVSQAVMDISGLEFELNGPLRIRFGTRPALTASDIRLSHPGRAETPLLEADRLEIRPRLLALLNGEFRFRSLHIPAMDLDYCQRVAKATADRSGTMTEPPSVAIDKILFDRVRIICSNPDYEIALTPETLQLSASAPMGKALELSISGHQGDEEWQLTLGGENLDKLLSDPPSYSVSLDFSAPASGLTADGAILNPLSEPGISARVEVLAREPERIFSAFGIEFPQFGEFQAAANLDASSDFIQVDSLGGSLGDLEFLLSGGIRGFTSRPFVDLDIQFEQIDLERLPPAAPPVENAKPGSTDFSDLFENLAEFDLEASVRIGKLLNAPLNPENLVLEARLSEQVIYLEKAELKLANSPVTATARLDMRSTCPQLTGSFNLSQLDLDRFHSLLDDGALLGGELMRASIDISSCGSSLAQHRDSIEMVVGGEGLNFSWNGEDSPLNIAAFDAAINWRKPGQLTLTGDWRDYALSLEFGFGSIHAVRSGLSWPLDFVLEAGNSILRLQGIAATGEGWIELDTHLLAQLGSSDLRGDISGSLPGDGSPMVIDLESRTLNYSEIDTFLVGLDRQQSVESTDWIELFTQTELLEEWLSLPDVDLDLSIGRFSGTRFNATDASLHAGIRNLQIEDGRLELNLEGVDIKGGLDVDLRERPWTASFESSLDNVNIGYLMDQFGLAEDITARAEHAKIRFVSEGESLRQLVFNSHLETRIEEFRWDFGFGSDEQPYEMVLSTLSIDFAPTAKTIWQASGTLNDVPVSGWMQTPSIQATFDRRIDLPLTLITTAEDDVTMFDAYIVRKDPDNLRVNLSVSGEFIDPHAINYSELESPLDDFEFRGDIDLKANEVAISNLTARIGSSQANGGIRIDLQDSGYGFDIDIQSPFLETGDLVLWAEDLRKARNRMSREVEIEAPEEPAEGDVLALISLAVDDLTQSNRYSVRINIDELRSEGVLLGKARFGLQADGKEFRLDPARIEFPEGAVTASYYGMSVDDGFESGLDMTVEGLEYGGLLRLFNPDSEGQGKLFLEASLFSHSPSPAEVIEHLGGTLDIALFPEDVNAEFLDLWASNLIFALLPLGKDSSKKMNCMVGLFEVENGVMSTKTTFLDSTDVIVRARGDIDLVRRELDLLVAPQSKVERFFSVSTPIEVSGPFTDFKVEMAPGGFVTTMIRWYYGLIYVPWKWLTGERFPADGIATCHKAMGWETP